MNNQVMSNYSLVQNRSSNQMHEFVQRHLQSFEFVTLKYILNIFFNFREQMFFFM